MKVVWCNCTDTPHRVIRLKDGSSIMHDPNGNLSNEGGWVVFENVDDGRFAKNPTPYEGDPEEVWAEYVAWMMTR